MLVTVPFTAPLFTGIDHVGVAVPDLDAAVEFYARTFGMRVVHQEDNVEQGVREAMLAVGAEGVPAPDAGTGGVAAHGTAAAVVPQIQLLAPLTAESTIAKFLDRS